jgi:hypothetical protein
MKTLSSLGVGTSVIAATVTAATVVAVAPAQAAQLNGSVGLSGNLDIQNTANGFIWSFSENVVNDRTLDFAGLSFSAGSSLPSIADLEFTCDDASPFSTCNTDPVTPFINFGEQTIDGTTDALTFNLDASQFISWEFLSMGQTSAFPAITGQFMFNGATLATGNFSGGYAGDASTYQMTLTTQEVPEPLTIMGTGLALGFGGLFQRKSASKRKNQKSA